MEYRMSQYEPWSHRQFRVEPPKWTVSHYESAARRMKSSSLGCTARALLTDEGAATSVY